MSNSDGNNSYMDDDLRDGLKRLNTLTDEKDRVTGDIKQVLEELKELGHSPRVVRQLLAIQRLEDEKRAEAIAERQRILDIIESGEF